MDHAKEFKGDAEALQNFVCAVYDLEADLIEESTIGTFKRIFNNVQKLQETFRSQQLAKIMSEMEAYYNIPMLNNAEYNGKNKEAIALYREMSATRNI